VVEPGTLVIVGSLQLGCISLLAARVAASPSSAELSDMLDGLRIASLSVAERVQGLYGFELEPEVRDWLDNLSDSDCRRVDEVCETPPSGSLAFAGKGSFRRARSRETGARCTKTEGSVARVARQAAARDRSSRRNYPREQDEMKSG
jgi:hypothetical protein